MTATGHALVATMIAAKFHNPLIALPIAFGSHFICDLIPHWDEGTHWREKSKQALLYESIFDVAMSITVSLFVYVFFFHEANYLFLLSCIFVSQVPDYLTAPYLMFHLTGIWEYVARWSYTIQHHLNSRLDKPWGIITTLATIIFTYVLLFKVF